MVPAQPGPMVKYLFACHTLLFHIKSFICTSHILMPICSCFLANLEPSFCYNSSSEGQAGQAGGGDGQEEGGQAPGLDQQVEQLGGQEAAQPVGQVDQASHMSLGENWGRKQAGNHLFEKGFYEIRRFAILRVNKEKIG